jgi:hypothetical protein
MPWKECSVMDERLQFVGRRLAGESMAELSAMADATIDFMICDPANADKHGMAAFDALWRIVA